MAQLPHKKIAAALLQWYDTVHTDRAMPWRNTRDAYAIWLSEIMLQQTQVETVKPYYRRFLEKYPTVTALAQAPLQDVLAQWAGLGYYRRAKHLHAAAQRVAETHRGTFPNTLEQILDLPGIGRYTAGAICSIAHNLPAPAVDGNVMRVLSRVALYQKDIVAPKNQAFFWKTAEQLHIQVDRHGDLNQSLMELGATVCVPANPRCGECPLKKLCRAHAEGRQSELPVKAAKKASPVIRLAAMIVLRETGLRQEVLLMQRPHGSVWEGMWEFPAFDAANGPPSPKTISKALGTRLGRVTEGGEVKHTLTHRTMYYTLLRGRTTGGVPSLPVCPGAPKPYVAAQWVAWPFKQREELPMATVVRKIAEAADLGLFEPLG